MGGSITEHLGMVSNKELHTYEGVYMLLVPLHSSTQDLVYRGHGIAMCVHKYLVLDSGY